MQSSPSGKIGFHGHLNSRRKVKLERDPGAEARLLRVSAPGVQLGRGIRAEPGVTRRSRACECPQQVIPDRPASPGARTGSPLRYEAAQPAPPASPGRAGQGCGSAPPLPLAPGRPPECAQSRRWLSGAPVTPSRRRRRLAAALPPPSLYPSLPPSRQDHPTPPGGHLSRRSRRFAFTPAATWRQWAPPRRAAPRHASREGSREEAGRRPAPAAHHEEGLRGAPRPPPQQGRGGQGRWAAGRGGRLPSPSPWPPWCWRALPAEPGPPLATCHGAGGGGRGAAALPAGPAPLPLPSGGGGRPAPGPGRRAIPRQPQGRGAAAAAAAVAARRGGCCLKLRRSHASSAAVLVFSRYPPSFPVLFSTDAPPRFLRAKVAVGAVLRFLPWQVENVFITTSPLGALKCSCSFLLALYQRMQSAFLRDAIAQQNLLTHYQFAWEW